ncbi:MAG: LPS export ABC transporter periplasmic protein LptC [Candidatus Cloacimonadaceae bacterium]
MNRIILLLLLTILLSGCGKSVLDQTTPALNRSLPDETSRDVTLYSYKADKVDYILTASRIERFYSNQRLHAWQVKIVSYDDKMRITSTLAADTAYVDEARNFVQAMGNVVLESSNGTIKSQHINWDRNVDEIYTDQLVTLIREGKTLRGYDLRTNSLISYAELTTVSAEGKIQGDEIDW